MFSCYTAPHSTKKRKSRVTPYCISDLICCALRLGEQHSAGSIRPHQHCATLKIAALCHATAAEIGADPNFYFAEPRNSIAFIAIETYDSYIFGGMSCHVVLRRIGVVGLDAS